MGEDLDVDLPDLDALRVQPGAAPRLRERATRHDPVVPKAAAKATLAEITRENADLQEMLYATGSHAVLLVFQAMDAAGKDSTIEHVLTGINPQGCHVTSFKAPAGEELDHDFLWRINRALPRRGQIGVFNRSHYEETLAVRVHPEYLHAQHLPGDGVPTPQLWDERYEAINAFERRLVRSGTAVVKFFLHVSKDEQRKRLLRRLDDPAKYWKFDPADMAERERWEDYLDAYEDTLRATSTEHAPWFVVPADDKPTMRLVVAAALRDTLRSLDLRHAEPDAQWWEAARAARTVLADDA